MTEKEFRNLVRQQILEKFEEGVKKKLASSLPEPNPISESDLRNYINLKLQKKILKEQDWSSENFKNN